MLDLGDVQVARFSYSPLRSRRTPTLIRKGDPEQYQLGLVTKGAAWFAQNRSETELRAGDLVWWDTSRPFESGSGTDGRIFEEFVLQIPKERMPLPSQRVDQLLAQRTSGDTGMGAILSRFLISLVGSGPECRPEDLAALGSMAVEMAASCAKQQFGAVANQQSEELRTHVLLRRVNAFIDGNLADPDLTPGVIAARHHISLRSLYALFEHEAESVAASIRRRRLERCRRDLACAEQRRQPIHAIATRWGFTNAAAFSRAFRAAYGITPNECRTAAMSFVLNERDVQD